MDRRTIPTLVAAISLSVTAGYALALPQAPAPTQQVNMVGDEVTPSETPSTVAEATITPMDIYGSPQETPTPEPSTEEPAPATTSAPQPTPEEPTHTPEQHPHPSGSVNNGTIYYEPSLAAPTPSPAGPTITPPAPEEPNVEAPTAG